MKTNNSGSSSFYCCRYKETEIYAGLDGDPEYHPRVGYTYAKPIGVNSDPLHGQVYHHPFKQEAERYVSMFPELEVCHIVCQYKVEKYISSSEELVEELVEEILHECDGPLTRFVLISRAMKLQRGTPEERANALFEALEEIGDRDSKILIPTDS